MTVYAWKGINAAGKAVKGVRDADSPKLLRTTLKRDGVMVTEVLESSEAAKLRKGDVDFGKFFNRVKTRDIAVSTQQLAVLLRSGIPLVEALTALTDQLEHEDLKSAFTEVRDKVNEGISFADALSAHKTYFEDLYIHMVAAGEASGTLEAVLERLAETLDAQANLKAKVQGALAYPFFMAGASGIIIMVMMTVVVPKVTAIFEDFDQALPWYTEVLIGTSHIISGYWWLLILLIGGAVYGFRRWKATTAGTEKWDRILLRLPLFGPLLLMAAVARFSRTLSTLLKSGVPMLRAMEITRNVIGNTELMRVVDEAKESVREGEGLSKPLRASRKFPPIVTHMISIGEKSGQLEEMLEHVAKAYDREVDTRVAMLTSLLEPLIIVVMGGISGAIAFSILMPLLQINEFIG